VWKLNEQYIALSYTEIAAVLEIRVLEMFAIMK
jgi:hypothetical protein